jgi:hypothetical protein
MDDWKHFLPPGCAQVATADRVFLFDLLALLTAPAADAGVTADGGKECAGDEEAEDEAHLLLAEAAAAGSVEGGAQPPLPQTDPSLMPALDACLCTAMHNPVRLLPLLHNSVRCGVDMFDVGAVVLQRLCVQ